MRQLQVATAVSLHHVYERIDIFNASWSWETERSKGFLEKIWHRWDFEQHWNGE
jgi:hypothetical protein